MLTQEIKIKTAPAATPPAHRWIEAKGSTDLPSNMDTFQIDPTIVPIAHQDEDGRNVQQYNVFGILVDVEQF
jgi:hypothetical protein